MGRNQYFIQLVTVVIAFMAGGTLTMGGLKIDFPGAGWLKQQVITETDAVIKLGSLQSDHVLTVIYQRSKEDMESVPKLFAASPLAEEFFAVTSQQELVGKTAEELIGIIGPYLANKEKFVADQIRVAESLGRGKKAFAKVPMIINDQHPVPRFQGRAYHPIIAHSSAQPSDQGVKNQYMTVLYLDLSHIPFIGGGDGGEALGTTDSLEDPE